MEAILEKVRSAVFRGDLLVSASGAEKISHEKIKISDLVNSLASAEMISEYPDHERGECVLAMHFNGDGEALHAVWGIPKEKDAPAVLVVADRLSPP